MGEVSRTALLWRLAALGVVWGLVQAAWWFSWLGLHEACTGPAGKLGRQSVIDGGMWPSLIGASVGALIAAAGLRLQAKRIAALNQSVRPVVLAACVYAAQLLVLLAADKAILKGCGGAAAGVNPNAGTAGALFIIWCVMALASTGLSLRNIAHGLRAGPSNATGLA